MLTRQDISASLSRELRQLDYTIAAWLGGSDATGRADDWSDVDLGLIVEPGRIEDAASAIHRVLESLSPIRVHYRMPWPTWHGFHQAFYQLAEAPEYCMVDWVMLERGQANPWMEVERHGRAVVLFDKEDLLQPTHVDRTAIDAAVAKKVAELEQKFQLFRHLPEKLIARNLPADAMHFYMSLVLRPLVDLLRCVHCPDRHDYGFRYVRADLPPAAWRAIEELSYVAAPSDLPKTVERARSEFDAAMRTWRAQHMA